MQTFDPHGKEGVDMIVQMDVVECKKAGSDSLLAARTYVPTANPRRLTATANRLILAPDERSLQVDLVRLDRTVPVPGCIGSRDPCPSTPTQRAAAQLPEAIGLRQP